MDEQNIDTEPLAVANVAHALLRAVSRLFWTPVLHGESVGTSAGAARKSAYATLK